MIPAAMAPFNAGRHVTGVQIQGSQDRAVPDAYIHGRGRWSDVSPPPVAVGRGIGDRRPRLFVHRYRYHFVGGGRRSGRLVL